MPARQTKRWALAELHRLPDDDGNKYEVVHGELFVTPAPTADAAEVAALPEPTVRLLASGSTSSEDGATHESKGTNLLAPLSRLFRAS